MRQWAFVLGLALITSAPAQAQYVFDPADLPEDFECEDDPDYGTCEYQKTDTAWSELYIERHNAWTDAILHRPEAFFTDTVEPIPEFEDEQSAREWWYDPAHRTPNLIDATFQHHSNLTRNWAFAINSDGILRLTRWRNDDELSAEVRDELIWYFPTSVTHVVHWADAVMAFEETDLRRCAGALDHFQALPIRQGAGFWDEDQLSFLPGETPLPDDDLILDGREFSQVLVRASGRGSRRVGENGRYGAFTESYFSSEENFNGPNFTWALKMREIVEPCLEPSEATPPWHKFVAAAEKSAE